MALKQLVSARLIMKGSGKHCAGGIIQDQEKKLKKKKVFAVNSYANLKAI